MKTPLLIGVFGQNVVHVGGGQTAVHVLVHRQNGSQAASADAAAKSIQNARKKHRIDGRDFTNEKDILQSMSEKLSKQYFFGSAALAEELDYPQEDAIIPSPLTAAILPQLQEKIHEYIKMDLPVTYVDEGHVSIGDMIHPCNGPRTHVSRTGQIGDLQLLYRFVHDKRKNRYLLVGCIGEENLDYIRKMIIEGRSADEIRAMWKSDVEQFKVLRRKYLLYEE